MNDKINDINTLLVPRAPLAAPAQAVPAPGAPRDPSITLDFKMATELLKMFGEEPGLVTLQQGSERSHSGTGIYALYSHLPEEGAEFLGAEPDNKAMPEAAAGVTAAPVDADTERLNWLEQNLFHREISGMARVTRTSK